jgi:hypothetical protein
VLTLLSTCTTCTRTTRRAAAAASDPRCRCWAWPCRAWPARCGVTLRSGPWLGLPASAPAPRKGVTETTSKGAPEGAAAARTRLTVMSAPDFLLLLARCRLATCPGPSRRERKLMRGWRRRTYQGTYAEAQECMQLVGDCGFAFDERIVCHLMRLEGAANPLRLSTDPYVRLVPRSPQSSTHALSLTLSLSLSLSLSRSLSLSVSSNEQPRRARVSRTSATRATTPHTKPRLTPRVVAAPAVPPKMRSLQLLSENTRHRAHGQGGACAAALGRRRGGGTAMQKLRIVILGFGTARQKMVLE